MHRLMLLQLQKVLLNASLYSFDVSDTCDNTKYALFLTSLLLLHLSKNVKNIVLIYWFNNFHV